LKTKTKDTKEQRNKKKLERELSDIRFVAKTPEGRRLLWRLLQDGGIFSDNRCSDVVDLARFEGRRSFGLEILKDIMAAKPSLYGQMQDEYASELKREEIEIEEEEKQSDPLSLDG
jgi:hypothetical protein